MEDLKSLERFLRTEEERSHRSQLGQNLEGTPLLLQRLFVFKNVTLNVWQHLSSRESGVCVSESQSNFLELQPLGGRLRPEFEEIPVPAGVPLPSAVGPQGRHGPGIQTGCRGGLCVCSFSIELLECAIT